MSTAEETRLPTPQTVPNVGSSMPPPESTEPETNNSTATEKKPRLSRACDTCRQKKLRCTHRRVLGEGEGDDAGAGASAGSSGKRKRNPRTPAPSQTAAQGDSSNVNTIDLTAAGPSQNGGNQAESSQAAAERPRRSGAGKRKLPEAFTEKAPSNASKRSKKAATSVASESGTRQRKKGKQPESAAVVIPGTPSSSDEPDVQQSQPLPPFNNNFNGSINMIWHQQMGKTYEQQVEKTQKKWDRLLATIEEAESQWQDVLAAMNTTAELMQNWRSHFEQGE